MEPHLADAAQQETVRGHSGRGPQARGVDAGPDVAHGAHPQPLKQPECDHHRRHGPGDPEGGERAGLAGPLPHRLPGQRSHQAELAADPGAPANAVLRSRVPSGHDPALGVWQPAREVGALPAALHGPALGAQRVQPADLHQLRHRGDQDRHGALRHRLRGPGGGRPEAPAGEQRRDLHLLRGPAAAEGRGHPPERLGPRLLPRQLRRAERQAGDPHELRAGLRSRGPPEDADHHGPLQQRRVDPWQVARARGVSADDARRRCLRCAVQV
mmetsp:Transcript_65118/g.196510  ORF Transcript_65118/g.196510 Transcript_65118/m.196510 type:complete len:270 (+) Transcript_65118:1462-2271(+)